MIRRTKRSCSSCFLIFLRLEVCLLCILLYHRHSVWWGLFCDWQFQQKLNLPSVHVHNIFIVVPSKNNGLCSSLLPTKLKIVNYQRCYTLSTIFDILESIDTHAAKQYCFFPWSIHTLLSVPFRIKCCYCNTIIDFTLVSLKIYSFQNTHCHL